ncbi:MAG: hypothetical protein PHH28_16885 [Desulfuromonadaceae bacterium]|nr:hypothetical protein [Desulfuromonadaceae bacterium]
MENKVPQITILFWVIKLLSTGMGEVASDFINSLGRSNLMAQDGGSGQFQANFQPPAGFQPGMGGNSGGGFDSSRLIVLGIMGAVLIATMIIQITSRRHVAWKYWLNVVVVAIFGTAAADAIGLGFIASTSIFAIVLAIILVTWFIVEKTLSIHSINTLRRELFYWITVIATFAMGTALGDMTAQNLDLGNLISGLMFVGIIAVPAIAYKVFHANEIVCFWFAYIVTRPLGASFADWMANERDGLGWGRGYVTLALTAIIIALVAYLQIKDNRKNTGHLSTRQSRKSRLDKTLAE